MNVAEQVSAEPRIEKMRPNKRRPVANATRVWVGSTLTSKTCTSCGEHKTAESFSPRTGTPDGKTAYCKACVADATLEYLKKFPRSEREKDLLAVEKRRAYQNKRRKTPKGAAENRANAQRYRALKRGQNCGCVSGKALTKIWDERNGCCEYCDKPAEHFDHVVPLARGGKHCASNLRLACAFCNTSKGAKTLSDFLIHMGNAAHPPVAQPMSCNNQPKGPPCQSK